jgi:hypothetical protein
MLFKFQDIDFLKGPKKKFTKNIWPKSCWLMEHTHLLCPYEKFQPHSIHMCGENEFEAGGYL